MVWALKGVRNRLIKKTFSRYNYYSNMLNKTQWYPMERLVEMQNQKLRHIVNYAYENVPYYHTLFNSLKLKPGDIQTQADLQYLPVLEKETVRQNPEAFVSVKKRRSFLYKCYTSGTTGKPLTIYRDLENVWFEHATLQRQWAWGGLDYTDYYATLKGEMLMPKHRSTPPYWKNNPAEHKLMMSIFHLSGRTVNDYLFALYKFKPTAIEGYPSTVHVLARLMDEHQIRFPVRAVFTSSEMLTEEQRDLIVKVFDAPVYDFFGSVERVAAIHTCEHGNYHVLPEYSVVEYLPINGNNGKGYFQLVGTTLNNEAMPLLRYRIGDVVVPSAKACSCGREMPVIQQIDGRQDDYILTPTGKWITRLDFIFKSVPGIVEGQIVQTEIDQVIVKIVPDSDYKKENGTMVKAKLADRLRDNISIQVQEVSSIPRGGRGKFRGIISYVHRGGSENGGGEKDAN